MRITSFDHGITLSQNNPQQLFRLSHATWTTVEVYVGVFVLAFKPVITGYYYEATSDGGHILEEGAS